MWLIFLNWICYWIVGWPRLQIDSIAISGFSSGGFFSQQMYMAHSEIFSGMATLSGGPYLCAEATGHTTTNLTCLYHPDKTNMDYVFTKTSELVSAGKISSSHARFGDKIYIWHGNQDQVVLPLSAHNEYTFWRQFAPLASVLKDAQIPANHGLSSFHENAAECGTENTLAFVENCNVSTVHRMLDHLFTPLVHLTNNSSAILIDFDQRPFTEGYPRAGGLDDFGLLYVPKKCATEICSLLVFLHGCTGGQEYTGHKVIVEAGFLPQLEANLRR